MAKGKCEKLGDRNDREQLRRHLRIGSVLGGYGAMLGFGWLVVCVPGHGGHDLILEGHVWVDLVGGSEEF